MFIKRYQLWKSLSRKKLYRDIQNIQDLDYEKNVYKSIRKSKVSNINLGQRDLPLKSPKENNQIFNKRSKKLLNPLILRKMQIKITSKVAITDVQGCQKFWSMKINVSIEERGTYQNDYESNLFDWILYHFQMCELKPVTSPLCASMSLSGSGKNNTTSSL